MTADQLKDVLANHALWLRCKGGKRANLAGADLADADLARAYLARANLAGADLARARLADANLAGANLAGADLADADLARAHLNGCIGNMREIKSMQIDKWAVTYTADTLQIGCQSHPINKWRMWDTEAGRKWIAQMDDDALEGAERNLSLVLHIIAANPATPTGHEGV